MKISQQKTALVVDDEPELREILSEFYEIFGWKVICASDGVKALEILKTTHETISIIVSDYTMPRLNGLEFLKQCRELGYTHPFLFFSGFVEHLQNDEAKKLNVHHIVDKGIDYQSLITASEEILLKKSELQKAMPT